MARLEAFCASWIADEFRVDHTIVFLLLLGRAVRPVRLLLHVAIEEVQDLRDFAAE